MNEFDKIEKVIRHIENVQKNCEIIAKKLCEAGDIDTARRLIANGMIHDNSKFYGIEWDYLGQEELNDILKLAISQHNRTNAHHPEFWSGIKNMPRLYLAEMVADWAARASEFGESLHQWIEGGAMKRFEFTKRDKIYKEIAYFANLLCDKPFKQK